MLKILIYISKKVFGLLNRFTNNSYDFYSNRNHNLTDSQYSYKVFPNLSDEEKFIRNTIETPEYRSLTVNLKKDFLDSCDFSEIFTKDFTARFCEDFLILSRQNSMVRLYIRSVYQM